ncbi:hypothetical protein NEOLEDRAFT_1228728, partial [Neolentinus lepideus HHB14362 ss-1]
MGRSIIIVISPLIRYIQRKLIVSPLIRDVDRAKRIAKRVDITSITRKAALIEDSIRTVEELALRRIPESPSTSTRGVANKDTLASVRLKRLALLLAYKDISERTKDPEVGDIGFLSLLPQGIGNCARERRARDAVMDMDKTANSISPERRRELSLEEHSSNSGLDSLVSTLSNPVLIRLIRLRVLAHNTLLATELVPILANILAALIIHRRLDLGPKLSLHLRLKDFKCGKGVALML